MNKLALAMVAVLTTSLTTVSVTHAEDAAKLETPLQKASYGVGFNIGTDLRTNGMDLDAAAVAIGLADALGDKAARLTEADLSAAFAVLRRQMEQKQQAEMMKSMPAQQRAIAEKNTKEGAAFLANNSQQQGVVTLPSGLQYKVIKQGNGATPTLQDTVKTHYRGRLLDGTEFDSSFKRNQPAEFPVGGVISGWTEALQLMKVGDKWELYVPAALGYGLRGAGQKIGPNATLIFEIELLEVL